MADRHALFIIGEYRTFDWCQLWYANKIPNNIDVYVSTYDTSVEKRKAEAVRKNGKWTTVSISNPNIPFNSPHNQQEYSINYTINGINAHPFQSAFGNKLKGINIDRRRLDEWYGDNTPTTKYLIQHLKTCLGMLKKQPRTFENIKNIYVLRIDSIPTTQTSEADEVFTFNQEVHPHAFKLEEGTLYSPSSIDMENWSFANDTHFAAQRDTMVEWINYMNPEKHQEPHEDIAKLTGELVRVYGKIKHKPFYGIYGCEIIRRGMIPLISWKWQRGMYPFGNDYEKIYEECHEMHYNIN